MRLIINIMKNLFILFLISCAFFSCKKERAFHITATNVATGERIPNLRYYVVEASAGSFGEKTKTIREGDLDANGEAKFNIKIKNKKHVIRVVEPENNCYAENISLTFGSKEDFKADFKFAPCAYTKNNITNINCLGADDKIDIQLSRFVDNNYGSSWIILGCNGYVQNHYSKIPMGTIYYRWVVTRSGINTTYRDTVFLEENSYSNFDINY